MRTAQPADADEAAQTLADASRAGERVLIQGGGTKSHWIPASENPRILLSTTRLTRVLAHRHGDLTATIEAGAVLDDVNQVLGRHGQWLPLDPTWSDRATIGGIVATNDAGPRRHRYGAPRDLIIGIDIARADGTRAKAGGIVVKNVAGYDLARLMSGSFGALGLILSATFKLYPLPASSRTVVADAPSFAAAGELVNALNASQLTPTALEVQTRPLRVLIRFESTERSVEYQAEAALRQIELAGGRGNVVAAADEQRTWEAHAVRPWSGRGVVAKASILPGSLCSALEAIAATAGECDWEVVGRAGVGVLLLRIDAESSRVARMIHELRSQSGTGSVVVVRAPDELDAAVDRWGPRTPAFHVMQAVKRAFDPLGILGPLPNG